MKKIFGLFILIVGVLTLLSYKSEVSMFGKAVIPIIFNGDNATNRTNLNMHLRGDSASGYQIWGRNNIGSEFFLGADTGSSQSSNLSKEFYTNNISPMVGDTVLTVGTFLIIKKILFTQDTKINKMNIAGNFNSAGTTVIVNCILKPNIAEDSLILIYADTVVNQAMLFNYSEYDFDTEEFTFKADSIYYVGAYFKNTGANKIIVSTYPKEVGEQIGLNNTWFQFELGTGGVVLGHNYADDIYQWDYATNIHYYYTEQ